MRVAIVNNAVGQTDAPDQHDVMIQVDSVSKALIALGHEVETISCGLDLSHIGSRLKDFGAEIIFNLVEDLEGHGRLIHLFPFFLDAMAIPYTGSCAESILLTSNKIMAKERMKTAGLPVPEWIGPYPATIPRVGNRQDHSLLPKVWIIKSVWEHASVGLDENGILHTRDVESVCTTMKKHATRLGGTCFAEEFIDGREFNLSLLQGPDGVEILPPAEIVFDGYGIKKPRILGYRAKWDKTSYEYRHTIRTFSFDSKDARLISELKRLALSCWTLFGLRGYARVDFRVDNRDLPWILEINSNPCLSPDAGFPAAAAYGGIGFTEMVRRILKDGSCPKNDEVINRTEQCTPQFPMVALGADTAKDDPKGSLSLKLQDLKTNGIVFRHEIDENDLEKIRRLVDATGFFSLSEIIMAVELAKERLAKGAESGYHFAVAEDYGRFVGYCCFGPTPCTAATYDLYWIAIHPDFQGRGLGRILLKETEGRIKAAGGGRIYADTSQRDQYASTRAFYEACGFHLEAVLKDFYGPGEGKAIYCKKLIST